MRFRCRVQVRVALIALAAVGCSDAWDRRCEEMQIRYPNRDVYACCYDALSEHPECLYDEDRRCLDRLTCED